MSKQYLFVLLILCMLSNCSISNRKPSILFYNEKNQQQFDAFIDSVINNANRSQNEEYMFMVCFWCYGQDTLVNIDALTYPRKLGIDSDYKSSVLYQTVYYKEKVISIYDTSNGAISNAIMYYKPDDALLKKVDMEIEQIDHGCNVRSFGKKSFHLDSGLLIEGHHDIIWEKFPEDGLFFQIDDYFSPEEIREIEQMLL